VLALQGVQLKHYFRMTVWQRRRCCIPPLAACELLQQWQQLLAAGLPLLDCVRLAMPRRPSVTLRWQLWLLQDQLQQGYQLASILAQHRLLPTYQIALLAAGERQANIGKAMGQIVQQQRQTIAMTKRLKRSLLMPGITLLAGVAVCVVILSLLVPNIVSLVQVGGTSMPTATRWLLALSDWLLQFGHHLLTAGGVVLLLGGLFFSTHYGQALGRRIPAWIPFWSPIYKLQNEYFVMQLLASSQMSGVPILAALEQCQQACRSVTVAQQLQITRQLLATGVGLSEAFAQAGCQESQVVMLRLAERTGDLASVCQHISQQLEAQLSDQIERLSQLLEPLITACVAVLVGGLVIAIYLPLMQMGSLL
jgi:type II secretory pathway component PulF